MATKGNTTDIQHTTTKEGPAYRFERLWVWEKAMDFCVSIYNYTKKFPREETFGLTSQLRRAATSIPLNIAEGCACQTRKEFVQFLVIALRSQYELVTAMKLAHRLGFLDTVGLTALEKEGAEVGRLLQALINSLRTKSNNQKPTTNNLSK